MRGREVSVRPSSSSSRPSRRSGAKSSSPLLKPFDSEHVTFAIFMSESRRLSNLRMKTELGLALRYPTVREGLVASDHK